MNPFKVCVVDYSQNRASVLQFKACSTCSTYLAAANCYFCSISIHLVALFSLQSKSGQMMAMHAKCVEEKGNKRKVMTDGRIDSEILERLMNGKVNI